MYKFSKTSLDKLNTCHPDLVRLFMSVINDIDCTVLEGHRSNERQEELFRNGFTKARAGESKHNPSPSMAVDVAPYPIDWNDKNRFYYFGGLVLGRASSLGIKIRWGGDWNMNHNLKDQSFFDLPHFELV